MWRWSGRGGRRAFQIPVLLRGAEPALGFLGQNTWVDLRDAPDDPVLLGILEAGIRGEPPGPDARERVARALATVCPDLSFA